MAAVNDPTWGRLQAVFGGPVHRRLARYAMLLPKIAALEPELSALDDAALRKRSLSARYRVKSGEPLERLLPEVYALVREAGCRAIGQRHFDVQILGGTAMYYRAIAEMQTGEGKTLTATLPLTLLALGGKGAHLATANDYLAKRDALLMRPLYERLGLTVGFLEAQMPSAQRREAYACDITYGTAKEFGFDFLRDRLLLRAGAGQSDVLGKMLGIAGGGEQPVQRGLHFMLVDEADSILIDEARTPLVISATPGEDERLAAEAYRWAASVAEKFQDREHYEVDPKTRGVTLQSDGRRLVRELPKPASMQSLGMYAIYDYIERAIRVAREMIRDRHYIIRDGEIVIVDEFTGRLAEGRKWRAGLHQAVEAKEGVKVTVETGQAARVTMQDFMLRYQRLAGMTGTAASSASELLKIYSLRVLPIPTNKPPQRERLEDRVFGAADAKWQAIVDEVAELHAAGRPVLIGTRSIDKSEHLAALLRQRGIEPKVLNANRLEAEEAAIVSDAGQLGRVTVSTNMAGRGTDIRLGEGVVDLGGLHVVCTEMHESQRIDRQLIGRCGRQGDPGTFRQYLALDDDLLREGLGEKPAKSFQAAGAKHTGTQSTSLIRYFRKAQRNVERTHFRGRKILLYQEKERKKMQTQMGQDPYLDSPS